MAARRPFWKWHRWKSIGFCLWPPSTCIWNLKLKFQSKLDLCSGNHVVYRQTDGQTDKVNPVYPPSNFVGRGYNKDPGWLDWICLTTTLVLQDILAVLVLPRYGDSHVKDKMVARLSYLKHEDPYSGKMISLHWDAHTRYHIISRQFISLKWCAACYLE